MPPDAALALIRVREAAPVRAAFTKGLRDFLAILATFVTGRSAAARCGKALTLSRMVGTMVLARAVNDPALSAEILQAGARAFGGAAA